MSALNWKPIIKIANTAAEGLGHKLGAFSRTRGGMCGDNIRTVLCEQCYGCCWVAHLVHPGPHTDSKGYGCGGRLLKYRCGTPEAAGLRVREMP
jgi:hypothetical protein